MAMATILLLYVGLHFVIFLLELLYICGKSHCVCVPRDVIQFCENFATETANCSAKSLSSFVNNQALITHINATSFDANCTYDIKETKASGSLQNEP